MNEPIPRVTAEYLGISQRSYDLLVENNLLIPPEGDLPGGFIVDINNMPSVLLDTMTFRDFINMLAGDGHLSNTWLINTEKDCITIRINDLGKQVTGALREMIRANYK